MDGLIITKLGRAPSGELEARVSIAGNGTVPVTRQSGSWSIPPWRGRPEQGVLTDVARELQARARRFERREGEEAV